MKKLLLSLIALFSLSVHAMVEQTAVFDFSNLYSLTATPPLTQAEINKVSNVEAGIGLNVTNRIFSESVVSLSFPQTSSSGAGLAHYGNAFSLNIGPLTVLNFAVSGGCVLQSISFSSSMGILSVSAGRMNSSRNVWDSNGEQVSEVTIKVGNNNYELTKITVNYLRPSTPLNFLSSSPASGSEHVGTFKTMTLSFSSSVTKTNNASSIKLTGKDIDNADINQLMNVTSLGSTVTLTAPTPITKDASLKVSIPAGTFENSEGATNLSAIEIPFTLKAKRDIFNPISVDPEAGTVGELPQEIRLTFNNFAKKGTGVVKFKQQDGIENFPATYEIDTNDTKIGIIKHANGRIVDASTWIVEIPEGVFHNQYYGVDEVEDRWNAAMTLTYTIDGSQTGPQDSPTMKAAKELLKLTGVGYPSTETDTYKALDKLVKAEETPDDADLQAAMDALYNETTVVMPEEGNWYFIAGVNKAGKTLYLGFDAESDKTKLVEAQNNATAFKVTKATGSVIVFETKDGRFLHVPSALPNYGKTSTGSNLTDEQSDLNNLTLTKFKAADVTESEASPSELYGKLTILGKLDKNEDNGTTPTVYARFSYDGEARISTTADAVPLAFTAAKSNAFVLIKTTEPSSNVDIIYPRIAFRPAVIANAGDQMLLLVHGPASTSIAKPSLIYYTKSTSGADNEQRVEFSGTILTPTEESNTFSVNTAGLPAGEYNIVLEKGALDFIAPEGKTIVNNGVLTAIFTIQGGTTPEPGPGDVEPTASLSRTNLYYAGDELILTIGNVGKAILNNPTAPYFVYADGENEGSKVDYVNQILTSRNNSTASFNVATSGLEVGNYSLIMPKGTFVYEAKDAGKSVIDKQLSVSFSITNSNLPTTDFNETLTSVSYFNPKIWKSNSIVYKDIVLNDLIVYAYKYVVSQLVAGTGKVKIYGPFNSIIREGKLVAYPNIQEEMSALYDDVDFSEVTALRFVPDTPIISGELDNSPATYGFGFDVASFGDANYGKWLANPSSIAASDCLVNPAMAGPTFIINNETGYDPTTGIQNVINTVTSNIIYDLQGRRVQNMDKKGMYIVNGHKIVKN